MMHRLVSFFSLIHRFSFFRMFLFLLAIILVFPQTACAITASQINIYSQDYYTDATKWALAGTKRTLESAGCSLFSFAHAIQWLTQTRRGDELLTELIGVCNDPNGLQGHPECTHSDRRNYTGLAYQNHIKSKYGISNHGVNKTEKSFEDFLTTGGVIVFRGPSPNGGHIALAVDFVRNSDGVGFIHVIDSHPYSFHHSSARTPYYDSSFNQLTSYPTDGADYWIRYRDISNNSNYRVWIGLRMAPKSISISAPSSVMQLTDEPLSLTASVLPAIAYQGVVWSSSNTKIATVSAEGCVTPVSSGIVTITATSAVNKNVHTTHTLLVTDRPITAEINQGPQCALVGTSAQYSAAIQPDRFSTLPLTWSSSNPDILSINPQTGAATMHAAGDVLISASSDYGFEGQLQVRVIPPLSRFTAALPTGVQTISASAFENTDIQYFRCPEGLQRIESGAFANCRQLRAIYIPASVTSIAGDAFSGCSDLVIWSASDYVQSFAESVGCLFFDSPAQ